MIAARTRGAGTKALDDNRAMLEKEVSRIKQFEEKKVRGRADGGGRGREGREGHGERLSMGWRVWEPRTNNLFQSHAV